MDLRVKQLADVLVNYSCNVQKNEKVLINYEGECCKPLVKQLIKNIYARGGMPYVEMRDSSVTREILLEATEELLDMILFGVFQQADAPSREQKTEQ